MQQSEGVEHLLAIVLRYLHQKVSSTVARVGEDDQQSDARADVLLTVHFIVSVLARHVETDGLNEVRNGLEDALADGDAEAVLVQQVDDGH